MQHVTSSHVHVVWDPPRHSGGLEVVDYEITYRVDDRQVRWCDSVVCVACAASISVAGVDLRRRVYVHMYSTWCVLGPTRRGTPLARVKCTRRCVPMLVWGAFG